MAEPEEENKKLTERKRQGWRKGARGTAGAADESTEQLGVGIDVGVRPRLLIRAPLWCERETACQLLGCKRS